MFQKANHSSVIKKAWFFGGSKWQGIIMSFIAQSEEDATVKPLGGFGNQKRSVESVDHGFF